MPDAFRSRESHQPFACTLSSDGDRSGTVSVGGELDIASAPRLDRALRDAVSPTTSVVLDVGDLVVLDLNDLTFMDVLGLHAIIDATARAQRLGRRLVLLCGPPAVQRVFTLTGTAAAVEFHDRPAAAASTSV
jgi:anti-anti-sigma factor